MGTDVGAAHIRRQSDVVEANHCARVDSASEVIALPIAEWRARNCIDDNAALAFVGIISPTEDGLRVRWAILVATVKIYLRCRNARGSIAGAFFVRQTPDLRQTHAAFDLRRKLLIKSRRNSDRVDFVAPVLTVWVALAKRAQLLQPE